MSDPRTPAEIAYDATRLSPVDAEADQLLAEDEARPIPAELGGDSAQPFIGHEYADVSVVIDRRDGGMIIARTGEIGGRLLEQDEVHALYRFFKAPAVELVIMYHWRQWVRVHASPKLAELLDWVDEHFAAEAAETVPLGGDQQ
jgi:hypothetical protein